MFQKLDIKHKSQLLMLVKEYIFKSMYPGLKDMLIISFGDIEIDFLIIYNEYDDVNKVDVTYSRDKKLTRDTFLSGVVYGITESVAKNFKEKFLNDYKNDIEFFRSEINDKLKALDDAFANKQTSFEAKINYLYCQNLEIRRKELDGKMITSMAVV